MPDQPKNDRGPENEIIRPADTIPADTDPVPVFERWPDPRSHHQPPAGHYDHLPDIQPISAKGVVNTLNRGFDIVVDITPDPTYPRRHASPTMASVEELRAVTVPRCGLSARARSAPIRTFHDITSHCTVATLRGRAPRDQ